MSTTDEKGRGKRLRLLKPRATAGAARGQEQGANFRAQRKRLGVTVRLFAAALGLWEATVYDLERGRIVHGLADEEYQRWLDTLDMCSKRVAEYHEWRTSLRKTFAKE